MADPNAMPDWVLWVGGGLGALISTVALWMGWKAGEPQKSSSKAEAMIAAVGMGYGGSKEQTDELIAAVKDIAAAIRDKKQDEVQDTMESLLEELRRRSP